MWGPRSGTARRGPGKLCQGSPLQSSGSQGGGLRSRQRVTASDSQRRATRALDAVCDCSRPGLELTFTEHRPDLRAHHREGKERAQWTRECTCDEPLPAAVRASLPLPSHHRLSLSLSLSPPSRQSTALPWLLQLSGDFFSFFPHHRAWRRCAGGAVCHTHRVDLNTRRTSSRLPHQFVRRDRLFRSLVLLA